MSMMTPQFIVAQKSELGNVYSYVFIYKGMQNRIFGGPGGFSSVNYTPAGLIDGRPTKNWRSHGHQEQMISTKFCHKEQKENDLELTRRMKKEEEKARKTREEANRLGTVTLITSVEQITAQGMTVAKLQDQLDVMKSIWNDKEIQVKSQIPRKASHQGNMKGYIVDT
ncbi:hypothetical protein C8J56DRAFT_894855 [Mycena floridula]|nr:hypothetical protein C8J56DRAFT_894855 [Mycena floridula]